MIDSGNFEKLYVVIIAFLIGSAIGFGCFSLFYRHPEVPVQEKEFWQGTFRMEEPDFNMEEFGPV